MVKSTAKYSWVILIAVYLIGCTRFPVNNPVIGMEATQGPFTPSLFLVDNLPEQITAYRFILFNPTTGDMARRDIDFSQMGLNITLGPSRFNQTNGTEYAHYNPKTGDVILVSSPGYPEMGEYPADMTPPVPSTELGIYKTKFEANGTDIVPLYHSNLPASTLVDHATLNAQDQTVFMDILTYEPESKREIWRFDLTSRELTQIATIENVMNGKKLVEASDLRVSSDGRSLYQLVVHGDPQFWMDETLYLRTLHLEDMSINYKEVVTGGNLQYDALAISDAGNAIAFYTMDENQNWHLWVKDMQSEAINSVPIPGEVGNLNLYMTGDGRRILVGVKGNWMVYSLESLQYQKTPIDYPLAWDSSGRYLAGLKGNSYIIYDLETQTEIEAPLSAFESYNISGAQWH